MTSASYFDNLTLEDARHVFRFFGDCPHDEFWAHFVKFDDFRHLYLGGGPVSEICGRVFSEIAIGQSFGANGVFGNCVAFTAGSTFAFRVVRSGGPFIARLSLAFPPSIDKEKQLVSSVQRHCQKLKELRIGGPPSHDLKSLFLSLPSQLYTLSLHYTPSQGETKAIAMNCTRLRRLEIRIPDHDMEQFFSSLGSGLQHLTVLGLVPKKILLQVQKYCRNLLCLDVGSIARGQSHVLC